MSNLTILMAASFATFPFPFPDHLEPTNKKIYQKRLQSAVCRRLRRYFCIALAPDQTRASRLTDKSLAIIIRQDSRAEPSWQQWRT